MPNKGTIITSASCTAHISSLTATGFTLTLTMPMVRGALSAEGTQRSNTYTNAQLLLQITDAFTQLEHEAWPVLHQLAVLAQAAGT